METITPNHLPFEDPDGLDLRVGWSEAGSQALLGEASMSYAYCSTGKKATDSRFMIWGETFEKNDVITCCLVSSRCSIQSVIYFMINFFQDLDGRKVAFYKNEKLVGGGAAFENVPNRTRIKEEEEMEEGTDAEASSSYAVYFPHIATKNCRFQVNFGHEVVYLV